MNTLFSKLATLLNFNLLYINKICDVCKPILHLRFKKIFISNYSDFYYFLYIRNSTERVYQNILFQKSQVKDFLNKKK